MNFANSSRELAILCLCDVENKRLLVNEALETLAHSLDQKSLAFAHELIMGTLRFEPGLKAWVGQFVSKWDKLPARCRWLLLLSAYQLAESRSPDYAVLNEANKLAQRLRIAGLKPLVNAVLRKLTRQGSAFFTDMESMNKLFPEWLNKSLMRCFPVEKVHAIAAGWSNRPLHYGWKPGLAGDHPQLPHARKIDHLNESLDDGYYIQNLSSQAICELARVCQPNNVLDWCAAPGGKSLYLASFSNANVCATDIQTSRLASIQQNVARLNMGDRLQVINWEQRLALEPSDLVLVDAPCSALGIIGRHPEIKLHRNDMSITDLRQKQQSVVDEAWERVKVGGFLLYAVCSWDTKEIPDRPENSVVAQPELQTWASNIPFVHLEEGGFAIQPDESHDGFCGSLWQKVAKA